MATSVNERIGEIIASGDLYPREFVELFGEQGAHWSNESNIKRELSLRHDMLCILICNLEPLPGEMLGTLDEVVGPARKRRRTEEPSVVSGSTTSSSSGADRGIEGDQGQGEEDEAVIFTGEDTLRYVVLEGRSNIDHVQNVIARAFGMEPPTKLYDIFDRKERKFVELKCTLNPNRSREDFLAVHYPEDQMALVHVHAGTHEITYIGKSDAMPGETKSKEFLATRMQVLQMAIGHMESDLEDRGDCTKIILNCEKFNNLVSIWKDKTYWSHLDDAPVDETRREDGSMPTITLIREAELKQAIEDTAARNAPFMKFKGKLLPPPIAGYSETKEDTDVGILKELLDGLSFVEGDKANAANWFVKQWEESGHETFKYIHRKLLKSLPTENRVDLGIQVRTTVKNDGCPDLKQPDFSGTPKARYSAWMSNLMRDLASRDTFKCFEHLRECETPDPHPMARELESIIGTYYTAFSETWVASYCSTIKNVYSRLGGSYLKRGHSKAETPEVVIFPIYATGRKSGEQQITRRVSGFLIRGPQHARKPSDKIPIITVEMMGPNSQLYEGFIKNAHFITDNRGAKWCYRVNSITNLSPSYLTFITNATYLGANLVGELTMGDPSVNPSVNAANKARDFMSTNRRWVMERVVEGVMMAVCGGSQEEGALAIIRKIFMLKLNWKRGRDAYGSDTQGLADALNECLLDSPLALYFAKQARDFLSS